MTRRRTVRAAGKWLVTDSGVQSGLRNMEIDQRALDGMVDGLETLPVLRFFQWDKPVVTYGYLLDPAKVRAWSAENGGLEMVQRPTGGGAVAHKTSDLSLSLLWPRKSGFLPDKPSACYALIHSALRAGVRQYLGEGLPSLHVKAETCDARPKERFPVCFDEPVCDDVMLGGRKIIGGALRITRQAVLYQGAIQLRRVVNMEKLKSAALSSLMEIALQPAAAEPVSANGR